MGGRGGGEGAPKNQRDKQHPIAQCDIWYKKTGNKMLFWKIGNFDSLFKFVLPPLISNDSL